MNASVRGKLLLKIKRSVTTLTLIVAAALVLAIPSAWAQRGENSSYKPLLIQRSVRSWEFLCTVGKKAGIFGNESGRVEAWVYPLKVLRDFHLTIHHDGKAIPAQTLVRTIEARPESTTLVYAGDTFSIREKFLVPVDEPGAVITFEVETEEPLEIEVTLHRDFQLEWPAAIGGTYANWDAKLNAFTFGEESRKFAAVVGSPTAHDAHLEYEANYSSAHEDSFRLGATQKGRETKVVAIAGSIHGAAEATATYQKLVSSYRELETQTAAYYADYLKKTVSVELPDEQLQAAYDWSRVSLLQGLVNNPTMGNGLVAGYRTSGESQRPGFAWFFGRDAFWSTLALNSEGDFATARTALTFVAQFQREDGKIPHEIAQGASFVNWFKDYPYGFASADATPLFIIAMGDYVKASGDVEFAKTNWEKLWKAYEFMRSTYADGVPKNFGIGHGWVEGGPLLPVKSEFYQSGLAVEAQSDLAHLAKLVGKDDVAKTLEEQSEKERKALNTTFWSAEKKMYAFALDNENKRVDEASVLGTVPMWFGLLDEEKASAMISILAGHEHETDWGMRIISNKSAKYGGGGYHYGSVWPLFTGWASVGEYRYHRAQPAYDNLRANALLALDGSPGHVTEVLSGDYYQPLSTASPHQIWSAAMVISPVLRGMMGLQVNAQENTITLAPHLPANWTHVNLDSVWLGKSSIRFNYRKTEQEIVLEVERTGDDSCVVEFRPAVSLRAKVSKTELNGKPVPFKSEPSESDQHIAIRIPTSAAKNTVRIFLANDFALSADATLPPLGSVSEGMRIVTERWSASRDQVELDVSGVAGKRCKLHVWNAKQIDHVEGAELNSSPRNTDEFLWIEMPKSDADRYSQRHVVIHFAAKTMKH